MLSSLISNIVVRFSLYIYIYITPIGYAMEAAARKGIDF